MNHYDSPEFASRYAVGRRMSSRAMSLWMDVVLASAGQPHIRVALDVGCGTGRFLQPLCQILNSRVVGVDRSFPMLREASRLANDHIRLVQADATQLPLRDAYFGLAFLSMVYHHFADAGAALSELWRVIGKAGLLCLRTSTQDALDGVLYARFFPSALTYNRNKLPSRQEISATAKRSGFALRQHQVIAHPFAETANEYLEKIGQRVLSDLVAVPDDEFRSGLQALSNALSHATGTVELTEPIDFYVFEAR